MLGSKQRVFVAVASAALVCLSIRPAAAAGPFFVPWALGHIVLPLIVGSVAASAQPQASYAPGPGYYGGAAGGYAPGYYVRPPAYYAPSPGYYSPGYYRAPLPYARPMTGYYPQRGGYYPSRSPYYAPYGGHASWRSGGFRHRRW